MEVGVHDQGHDQGEEEGVEQQQGKMGPSSSQLDGGQDANASANDRV